MAKHNLPVAIHDHFQKANLLHGYFLRGLQENIPHALEAGQHLMAAKDAIPHGRWESECERLFDGSLRTAQFYIQFTRNMEALPKSAGRALLLVETTLKGAAKAAKAAANPASESKPKPKPAHAPPKATAGDSDDFEDLDSEHLEDAPPQTAATESAPDYGKCPNCAGTKWSEDEDGVACAKCHHPHGEPAGDVDEDRVNTQRQKTVKTAEALLRAFDDLQHIAAKPAHKEAVAGCKRLLDIAKAWK